MATNIPPHNLSEVVDALIALIDDPQIDIDGLMEHIPGPDFPTAGIINGVGGIHVAYRTGRGRVRMRARADVEVADNGRESRSEEHTSELQSLMRISYAVFCLKKTTPHN